MFPVLLRTFFCREIKPAFVTLDAHNPDLSTFVTLEANNPDLSTFVTLDAHNPDRLILISNVGTLNLILYKKLFLILGIPSLV